MKVHDNEYSISGLKCQRLSRGYNKGDGPYGCVEKKRVPPYWLGQFCSSVKRTESQHCYSCTILILLKTINPTSKSRTLSLGFILYRIYSISRYRKKESQWCSIDAMTPSRRVTSTIPGPGEVGTPQPE